MQPIPTPQILDPDRLLANNRADFRSDHQSRADLLDEGLKETCDYAQQLWNTLNGVRAYLMDSLPPDPRSPDAASRYGATPTGPDDEQGWQRWIDMFSATTSVLCGPHGDSGFGLSEARNAAEIRRSAPTIQLHATHPQLPTGSAHPTPAQHPAAPAAPAAPKAPKATTVRGAGWFAAAAALVVLAARGLRIRRS